MKTLLHTIALEPVRWTPARVSRPLSDLLPGIAQAGFHELEVFEPHLVFAPDEHQLAALFASLHLEPVILSSYLNVNPVVTTDPEFEAGLLELEERIRRFGFRRVRIFPGRNVNPSNEAAVAAVGRRLGLIAERLPEVEILLEAHDGSIADSPERLVQLVSDLDLPNVGILYQPTVGEREAALRQVEVQAPWIRHLHLQNHAIDGSSAWARLGEGIIPWAEIVQAIKATGKSDFTASVEFIPSAICPLEAFDLDQSLAEAVAEARYAESL